MDQLEIKVKLEKPEESKANHLEINSYNDGMIIVEKELITKYFDDMSKKHLEILEENLILDPIHDLDFLSRFIKYIISEEGGKANFIDLIKKRLTNKNLLFIRHAQAQHNEYNIYHKAQGFAKPKFFDPQITKEGHEQCKQIVEFINKLPYNIDIVFTSPLRRTLQTLNEIKEAFPNAEKKIFVTELLREVLSNPDTHIGSTLKQMHEDYQHMDYLSYQYLTKENWWSYDKDINYNNNISIKDLKESNSQFQQRLVLFIIWFVLREEKNCCMISHSKVYKSIFEELGTKKKNCRHGGQYIIDNKVLINYIIKYLDDYGW